MSPYFLVYGLEAILPVDVAFRAPRVENYDEEQAAAVRIEDVDRAEEERLITCVRIAKYLEGLRRYYNRTSKVVHLLSTTLFSAENKRLKGCTSSLPLGKGPTSSKRSPDQDLIAFVT